MRADGVELFRFFSARDPQRGSNLALFAPVFAAWMPDAPETWSCVTSDERVEWKPVHVPGRERAVFMRKDFLVRGDLPAPALG